MTHRRARPAGGRPRVLVISLSGLGNLILGTAVVRPIRARYPRARLEFAVRDRTQARLLSCNPRVGAVHTVPAGDALAAGHPFVRRLRGRYDVALCLYPSPARAPWLARLLEIPTIVGHPYPSGRPTVLPILLTRTLPVARGHDLAAQMALLRPLGIRARTGRPDVPLPRSTVDRARKEMSRLGIVRATGIHPGCRRTWGWKRWPLRGFLRVARGLPPGETAVAFLGPDEAGLAPAIRRAGVHVRVDRDILRVAAWIRLCKRFVSSDSSLMHLAASLGTPTLGIFGPTDPAQTAPPGGKVVRAGIPCSPCADRYPPFACANPQRLACLRNLSPERVAATLRTLGRAADA